ncbi:unnamed protein product, partial [Iphiclides podalirius]
MEDDNGFFFSTDIGEGHTEHWSSWRPVIPSDYAQIAGGNGGAEGMRGRRDGAANWSRLRVSVALLPADKSKTA